MDIGKAKVYYGRCLRNYAAWLGRHATDGCHEFAQGTDADSPFCLACGCHKNYHKKVVPIVKGDGLGESAMRKSPGQLYMNSIITRRLLGNENLSIEKKVEKAQDNSENADQTSGQTSEQGKKKVNTKESLISFNWMKCSSSSSSSSSQSKNA